MEFEVTKDTSFVHRCLTSPANWRMGSDDGMLNVNPALLFVQPGRDIWLKAGDLGVLLFEPRNSVTVELHVALLPEARGSAVEICKGGLAWLFNRTGILRIIASVPLFNLLAIRLAHKIGMEFIGTNKQSFLKHGVLHDQQLFGISKEALCHS